jgi:hypothetical protein
MPDGDEPGRGPSPLGMTSGAAFIPPMQPPVQQPACRHCGQQLPARARFCTACGTPVHPVFLPWLSKLEAKLAPASKVLTTVGILSMVVWLVVMASPFYVPGEHPEFGVLLTLACALGGVALPLGLRLREAGRAKREAMR